MFSETEICSRDGNRKVREVVETSLISSGGDWVVSKASLMLSQVEVDFVLGREYQQKKKTDW